MHRHRPLALGVSLIIGLGLATPATAARPAGGATSARPDRAGKGIAGALRARSQYRRFTKVMFEASKSIPRTRGGLEYSEPATVGPRLQAMGHGALTALGSTVLVLADNAPTVALGAAALALNVGVARMAADNRRDVVRVQLRRRASPLRVPPLVEAALVAKDTSGAPAYLDMVSRYAEPAQAAAYRRQHGL